MKLYFAIAVIFLLVGTLACRLSAPLVVSGTVADADGVPPALAFVALLSLEDYTLSASTTTTDGHYQLEAPGGQDYLLLAIPLSGETAGGYNLHGHTPQLARIPAGSGDVTHDFTLAPCHDFILESYDAGGALMLNDDWIGLRFVDDTAGNATDHAFIGIDKGEGTPAVPSVCIPLNQTHRFFVQWTLPDFGSVVLMSDNDGAGYAADAQGGTVLNLSHEMARTQINRLRDNLAAYQTAGYDLPPAVAADLAEAESLLAQAAAQTGAAQAALSDQAASVALWALENLEQARAEQDIPSYRTGGLTITVLDAAGDPLPGATVAYTQTSHDFLFGVFSSLENAGIAGYELMREAGVNYVTAGFYWMETEPEQDEIPWARIDHEIGVLDLAEMGFTLKAHALLALWDFGTPDYFKAMDFDEANHEVYEHIGALVERYRDQIDTWNVINEAHGRGAALDFTRAEITTLTETGIRAIREHDPDARIIINDAFDWYGEIRQMTLLTTGKVDDFTLSVPAYLDQLAADGVDYDVIGQQLYDGGYVSLFADWGLGDPMGVTTWDLAHVSALLDRLGEYGRPVHVTEQSVPSTWDPEWAQVGAGWWHHPWDEETQAEFLRDFYTIAFSKEQVEAITWWDINDNSFIFTGGLLDAENNPKPAYFALRDLIAGWTTAGQGETDATGQIAIRGYGGEYEMVVTHDDQTWRGTVHVWEQQEGERVIQMSGDVAIYLPLVNRR
jgi:GH35 family endo-1,4-beta-xylanase